MSDPTGSDRPGPDGGTPRPPARPARPWFRDETVPPTADDAATAVYPVPAVPAPPAEPRPFPPVQRADPAAPYGRMPPVGRRPAALDGYPAQPPAAAPRSAIPMPVAPRPANETARVPTVLPGGGPGGTGPRGPADLSSPKPKRWRKIGWKRPVAVAVVLFLVLPIALYFFADSRIDRVNAFPAASTRPADTPGTNWLIVGSDSRDGLSASERKKLATGKTTGQRTDTIMLLSIPEHGGSTLVSIPRDAYVPIPGHAANRINAAFAFGGPRLLIQTVEDLTRIRIDHYAEIGFGGLFDLVNAVGGVEMCIDQAKKDPKAGLDIKKGCQNLDGGEALGVARSRASTRGDLDRVSSQRELISALMDKVTSPSTLLNPFRAWSVATKGAGALTVHNGDHLIDLVRLAWATKSLGSSGTTTTVPIGSEPTINGAQVVMLDAARAETMFAALRQGKQVPKSAQMS